MPGIHTTYKPFWHPVCRLSEALLSQYISVGKHTSLEIHVRRHITHQLPSQELIYR